MGGTLALYARNGCDVYYVCATRGEVDSRSRAHANYKALATARGGTSMRGGAFGIEDVFFWIIAIRDAGMEDNKHPDAQIIIRLMKSRKSSQIYSRTQAGYCFNVRPDADIVILTIFTFNKRQRLPLKNQMTLLPSRKRIAVLKRGRYTSRFPHRFLRFVTRLMPIVGVDPRKFGAIKILISSVGRV